MPFAYYSRLKPKQKKIYDSSNRISTLRLENMNLLEMALDALQLALRSGSAEQTEQAAQVFANYFCAPFGIVTPQIKVLERRPAQRGGELHGLYQANLQRGWQRISLWMRTAKRIQVVAFKTFLRTFLHELLHHLDYHYYKFGDSFHTEGFYQRESSLMKQIENALPKLFEKPI